MFREKGIDLAIHETVFGSADRPAGRGSGSGGARPRPGAPGGPGGGPDAPPGDPPHPPPTPPPPPPGGAGAVASPPPPPPAAMIDRLVHHAEVISMKGDSYRLKDRDLGRVPAAKTND